MFQFGFWCIRWSLLLSLEFHMIFISSIITTSNNQQNDLLKPLLNPKDMLCWGKKGIEMSCTLDFFTYPPDLVFISCVWGSRISRVCFGHVHTFTKSFMTYFGAVRVDGGGPARRQVTLIEYSCHRPTHPVGGQLAQLLSSHKIFNFFWCIFHTLWESGEPSFYHTEKRNFLKCKPPMFGF